MSLQIILDSSPEIFLQEAGPLLYRDEPTNSLMLGLCGNLTNINQPPKYPPLLIRIVKDGRTVSAALQTPPMNLVITYAQPEELDLLAKHLDEFQAHFPGVVEDAGFR